MSVNNDFIQNFGRCRVSIYYRYAGGYNDELCPIIFPVSGYDQRFFISGFRPIFVLFRSGLFFFQLKMQNRFNPPGAPAAYI